MAYGIATAVGVGAGVAIGTAVGNNIRRSTTYVDTRSDSKAKEKDRRIKKPAPIYIYRYNGTNPGNLIPMAKDKNVWNNCAKILSDKSDEELSPYLPELFRWLKDLNWPGAICIYDRLIISEDELFEYELKVSITTAKAQNDKLWLLALKNLKKERKARDK